MVDYSPDEQNVITCEDFLWDREIHLLTTEAQIQASFPVVKQLRPELASEEYLPLVRQLNEESGYQLVGLMDSSTYICVAGFRLCHSLGWGRYLYVDDLVTLESHRSSGAGKEVLTWLTEFGFKAGCRDLRLDSALYRHDAHRFYLRERMDIHCFHFKLPLEEKTLRTKGLLKD